MSDNKFSSCVCGEDEEIYSKLAYCGYRGNSLWVVECQRCGFIVPVVHYKYEQEVMVNEWNRKITEAGD